MAYTKTNWQDNVTPLSAQNMNKIEQGIADAHTAANTVQNNLNNHIADYVRQPGYAAGTGSANAYSVTLNPAPTAYVDGMAVAVKINVDNTGASTLNVNGLGANLQGEGGSGNAQPADVLSGKTFSNDDGDQVGTMPNRTGHVTGQSISRSGTTLRIRPQPGYYPGDNGNSVQWNDPNWVAQNIRQGVSIFGLAGTLVEGKKFASGSGDIGNQYQLTVSGLDFRPFLVVLNFRYSTSTKGTIIMTDGNYLLFDSTSPDTSAVIGWTNSFESGYFYEVPNTNYNYITNDGFTVRNRGTYNNYIGKYFWWAYGA